MSAPLREYDELNDPNALSLERAGQVALALAREGHLAEAMRVAQHADVGAQMQVGNWCLCGDAWVRRKTAAWRERSNWQLMLRAAISCAHYGKLFNALGTACVLRDSAPTIGQRAAAARLELDITGLSGNSASIEMQLWLNATMAREHGFHPALVGVGASAAHALSLPPAIAIEQAKQWSGDWDAGHCEAGEQAMWIARVRGGDRSALDPSQHPRWSPDLGGLVATRVLGEHNPELARRIAAQLGFPLAVRAAAGWRSAGDPCPPHEEGMRWLMSLDEPWS